MKEINPEKYLSAEETANRLDIQKSTLRKYAGMLDSVDTKKPFFYKDDTGIRLYTEEDISWLEQLIRIKTPQEQSWKRLYKVFTDCVIAALQPLMTQRIITP